MFQKISKYLLKYDPVLLSATLFLLIWSYVFINGIAVHIGGKLTGYGGKQLVWICLGLVTMFIVSSINYQKLGEASWFFYLGAIFLLLLVLLIGSKINGARSWINLPGGVTLQPGEFAKPTTLFFGAWLLANRGENKYTLTSFIPIGICFAVPFILINMQPDFGTSLVLIPILATILYIARIDKKWIYLALIVGTLAVLILYFFILKDYQVKRIDVFLGLIDDKSGAEWNTRQCLNSVGSGGLFGQGIGKGTMYALGYLPQNVAPTDLIFSVIAEETGFIGCSILILTYLLIILRAVFVLAKTNSFFGKFIVAGAVGFLLFHFFINIGMNIGIVPIVGIPLPLMSYGGSFMITCMTFMGLLQNVYIHRNLED